MSVRSDEDRVTEHSRVIPPPADQRVLQHDDVVPDGYASVFRRRYAGTQLGEWIYAVAGWPGVTWLELLASFLPPALAVVLVLAYGSAAK
ncbi:hypothetical protein GCM10023321_79770 [Pseudonocardia eucalypti]|uniref:Uncharacterized protein n=1 Tax=Pseudonocardia eucalypti TaxID=648755 RepID=A0ABP9RDE4_9PSEU